MLLSSAARTLHVVELPAARMSDVMLCFLVRPMRKLAANANEAEQHSRAAHNSSENRILEPLCAHNRQFIGRIMDGTNRVHNVRIRMGCR